MTSPLRAQTSQEHDARQRFVEAVEELRVGRFPEAREMLQRLLASAPNPAIAFNLAVAYRGTGELLRAEEVLSALLAEQYGEMRAEQRAEVRSDLRRVRSEIGALAVQIQGAEGELRVDGRLAAERTVRVDPGEHVLVVSAEDFETVERRVRVRPGERLAISIELQPTEASRVGTIVLEAANPSHELEIVGVARGVGRLEHAVAPGQYVARVRAGAASHETTIRVRARSQTRYVFDEPGRSIVDEPAFWIVGAVLLAAAGATALGVGLSQDPSLTPPVTSPPFGVVIALEMP